MQAARTPEPAPDAIGSLEPPSGKGADLRRSAAPALAGVLVLAVVAGSGCASRGPIFAPAGGEEVARALEAWRSSVARAEQLPPSRLLYEARLTQGMGKWTGTLAVTESAGRVEASLTGPFGSPVAAYADGELRGERIRTLAIGPEDLRSLLAGVWKAADPRVRGVNRGDALLVWGDAATHVEGVLDVEGGRFRSLEVSRPEGKIVAAYAGTADPWPTQIALQDSASGARMRLKLLTREAQR